MMHLIGENMKTDKCNRREFFKTAGLGAAYVALSVPRGGWAQTPDGGKRPPNILFRIADDRS
jgi:hypothetical protein